MPMASPLLTWLLDLIYPPKCALCDKPLPSGKELLCPQCQKLPDQSRTLRKEGVRFTFCVSALPYRDDYRSSILRYKFGRCSYYSEIYGKILADAVRQRLSGKFDLITYIPLNWRRRRKRGYDQAKLLAEALGRELNVEVIRTLVKVKNVKPQSSQPSAAARRINIRGAYGAKDPAAFAGKRILLVDDVLTTGSTMSEAAGVLRDNGAKTVYGATIAAVVRD